MSGREGMTGQSAAARWTRSWSRDGLFLHRGRVDTAIKMRCFQRQRGLESCGGVPSCPKRLTFMVVMSAETLRNQPGGRGLSSWSPRCLHEQRPHLAVTRRPQGVGAQRMTGDPETIARCAAARRAMHCNKAQLTARHLLHTTRLGWKLCAAPELPSCVCVGVVCCWDREQSWHSPQHLRA